ncbi:MAG: DUF983 domain-containing protein [Sphingorhabdus sp.]
MTQTETSCKGQPGLAEAALFGLCPECGAKTLFAAPATFAPRCTSCGLDYSAFNVGDGPAAILTLFLGALIIALAIGLDIAVRPPFWVHALIWVLLTAIMVLFSLRFAKGVLLISEHRNRAAEGRLADKVEKL